MVQYIDLPGRNKQSQGVRFLETVGNLSQQYNEYRTQKQQQKQLQQETDLEDLAVERLTGQKISGIKNPKIREQAVAEALRGETELKKLREQSKFKNEQYKNKVDYFAEKFGRGGNPQRSGDGIGQPEMDQAFAGEEFQPSRITDDDVIEATLLDPVLGKTLGDIKKADIRSSSEKARAKQSKFESDRSYHSKTSDPILEKAANVLQSAPIKKALNNQQRIDIQSGNTSGIIPYLVEKTGAEIWRNPESARFKTIAKESFVESLNSIGGGARPNQFIERQLADAQPALGRSAEANLTILDMLEFKDDLIEKRADLIRDFAKLDRDELGYVRNDVAERADAKMAAYADKRQQAMAYDIRQRREANMNDQELAREISLGSVVPGTPLTVRASRILMLKNGDDERKAQAEAKRLGFTIPDEETYLRGAR